MSARRIAVVGAGIMGLSVAWALARRGDQVHVLDQGPIPNPLGASNDQHRLIRHAYGAERGYTRMVSAAFNAWELVWTDLGERLYAGTGTLALSTGAGTWLADTQAALAAERIPFRVLDRATLAREFSLLDVRVVREAIHLATGGTLFAGAIVASLARHLAARGARIEPDGAVAEIDPERGRIVRPDGSVLETDEIVVAAGPWTGRLLPKLAARALPSRQIVVYLDPPPETQGLWERHPMILNLDPEAGFYLVPPRAGAGLKVGDHGFTLKGDPDREREAGAEEAAAVAGLCRTRIAGFERYRIASAKTCFYDVAPGERFILERLGARAWVMGGFSGHGFKFAPLLGLELARAIAGEREAGDLARWAAGREPAAPDEIGERA